MADADLDTRVRAAAFQFLREQMELRGDEVLPREVLAKGFEFEGQRVPLIAPQGIFKPAVLPEMPLSITTVPVVEGEDRPYDDGVGPDGSCDIGTVVLIPCTATIRRCVSRCGGVCPSSTSSVSFPVAT